MCGIAGHLSFPSADLESVRRMSGLLTHRGPDGEGFHADGPIALGHRRLSIIDVEGGAQPQFNEDRTIAVVFNGEIYNYVELAGALRGRHTFRTESDTEVLVHLYEEEGDAMIGRLRGMFAFALWDGRRRRLLAARDRFGEKPFLYAIGKSGLYFASELCALVSALPGPQGIDRAALSDYLELLYIPAPRTIYQGISKLPAGHLLLADERGVTTRPYWTPPVPGSGNPAGKDLAGDLRHLLREAVALRLRSDVPIGALLSGGIDSSAVVALMAKELGPGVKTFSVGFGRPDDELPYARIVAERYRTDHREIVIQEDAVTQATEALVAYSEPFGDSSAVPTVAICKEVARHVKVVLTGDGGDELFAGYGRYRRVASLPTVPWFAHMSDIAARLPAALGGSKLRRATASIGSRGWKRNRALIEVFSMKERRALLGNVARVAPEPPYPSRTTANVDAAIAFDLGAYLPDDLLVKTDIASMRWGLEARCPLLDHVLAEQVVPLPAASKQNRTEGKLSLKFAVADLLPEAVLNRTKRGFGSPIESWLRGPLRPFLQDLVGSPMALIRDWLDGAAIDRAIGQATSRYGNAHQAWALLALESWARNAKSVAESNT